MASSKDKWVRRFFIAEIGYHRDGFTIYKVTSLIFLKKSPEITSKVSVWKRYNDFRKLHKSLEALNKYSPIKEPFPSFAKRNYFRRFEKEVVNERRKCAIRLLEFIAKHSVLYTSDVFIQFFETSLDPDDNTYNVDHSVTSSDDDCNMNYKHNDRKCSKHQNAIDTSFDANSTIAERHHVYTNHEITSSTCIKPDNITLNFNVNSPDFKDNRDKNEECCQNQLNDFVTLTNTPLPKTDNNDYIIVAAAHMSAGHQHELLGEYEEAYIQYKYSITHLQIGAEVDPDPIQQKKVLEKIKKHINRLNEFYEKYLYHNSSMLSKPVTELENYKVLGIIGRVMVVKDTRHVDVKRVIKTIEKCIGDKDIFHCILREKVPFMVNLHAYVQTESTIFLIVEYACGGLLWNFIKSNYEYKDIKYDNLCNSRPDSTVLNSLLVNTYNKPKNHHSSSKNYDFHMNLVDIPRKLDCEPDACLNISTNKLMEKSQELLKSVDKTLKKSNSMINKNETAIFKSDKANDTLRVSDTTKIKNNKLSESSLASNSINHSNGGFINISNSSNIYDSFNESIKSNNNAETSESHVKMSAILNTYFQHESSEINIIKINQKNWQIPETVCKQWAAQLLLAIEAIHEQNVIISNLRPDDLLIDENNHFVLSYIIPSQFNEFKNLQIPYAAPELFLYLPHISANEAADIWSFGIILYELLTGISFQTRNPGLFNSHSFVNIPEDLTETAKHLLVNILKFKPNERLAVYQIKQHAFFGNIDWKKLHSSCSKFEK